MIIDGSPYGELYFTRLLFSFIRATLIEELRFVACAATRYATSENYQGLPINSPSTESLRIGQFALNSDTPDIKGEKTKPDGSVKY